MSYLSCYNRLTLEIHLKELISRARPNKLFNWNQMIETNNHFVQSFSLVISVKRISVLCFEYFASFLDGEILINCLELNLLQYQNFCK
ncbi:hypothetical protein Avbf_16596 [Armadillidium vulgare]|nr:hypothetical protein Avbf_16596 [Armadillidium vulgare]